MLNNRLLILGRVEEHGQVVCRVEGRRAYTYRCGRLLVTLQ